MGTVWGHPPGLWGDRSPHCASLSSELTGDSNSMLCLFPRELSSKSSQVCWGVQEHPNPIPEGLCSSPAWLRFSTEYRGHRESSWVGTHVMGFISPVELGSSAKAGGNASDLRAREAARAGAAQGQTGDFLIYTKETHSERGQRVSVSDPDTPARRLILSLRSRQILLLGF